MWSLVWCGSKNGYQKDMCSDDIELHPQKMIAILGSRINMNEGTYMTN